MNRKIVLLLLVMGMASALWVNVNSEYMPGETISIGVGGAEGQLIVDVLDENGSLVFHEVKATDSGPYGHGSYETFELSLPSGAYDVVAKDSVGGEDSEEFRVSSIGLMVVVGSVGEGVFMHKADGSAVEGGRIIFTYNKSGEIVQNETVSGAGGLFAFEREEITNIRGEYNGETAEVGFYYYYPEPEWGRYEYHTSYVFSDKTLYQPGEAVHLSAVIFLENESAYETVLGSFEVEIRDPQYEIVYTNSISSVNSRISFDFPIDEEAALGRYSVQVRKNQSYAGWYNFDVQEYKRPEIDVSLKTSKDRYTVNETVYVEVETNYYFGGAADAEVKFEIYQSPHYWPLYRNYYDCMPYPYWNEVKVADGLIYTQGGVGTIEWDGANVTGDYKVKVSATDESEVISEAETTFSVLEKVNLEALIPSMEANKSAAITLLAYNENDEPLDLEGTLKIYLGGEYYYYDGKQVVNDSAVPIFETNFSTENGTYNFEFAPPEYGGYYLVAESGDAKTEEYFYVSEWSWWSWNYLEVSLDKEEYVQGEEIEVAITSPTGGKLTVVSMGEVPAIEFFTITPGINTLQLTAEETSTLQFYIIKDGERYSGYGNYIVRGNDWINISIEHGDVYGPGDIARLVINAERGGARSNAAASLAIVDQAIIDLSGATWNDIYRQFYGYPLERYEVRFSWDGYGVYAIGKNMMVDAEMEGGAPMPSAAEGEEQASREEIRVREKFVETAFWIPYIILENGKKEIIWHIPDTLTTWNITVVANEGVAVGMGSSDVLVTKDVIGRMSLPPALVVDDAAAIPITVFNYGEGRGTFKITLETTNNIWILGSPVNYVSLESGESKTVYIPVKAMEAGEGECTLWIEGGEGDAVKLPLEVLKLGIKIIDGQSGVVESTPATVSYDSPENANVTLYLHSSIISSAFESLDYLVNYPYGCIEQTMSGFLPNVVLVNAINELGVEYAGDENLTALIDDGLERIYEHQNADGSWGWFRGKDDRITAYVMSGLSIAKKAGIDVDGDVYSRGLSTLKQGNSSYGRFVQNRIDSSLVHSYANDSFGALAECDDGDCEELVSMLECAGDYCHLEYDGKNKWYHSDIELTSYAVESLVGDGKTEDARKCVNWLMVHKTGRYWRSTKDTACTVLALTEYAKETREMESDYLAYVYLDGEKIFEKRLGHKGIASEEIVLPVGVHEIKIERTGLGPLYYNLIETYYTDEIPEGDIEVERKYGQTFAKVGDEITVTLHINGSGEFVAIEDPIPMGTEIIKEDANSWWYWRGYRMEARAEKAVFFFDNLEEDTEITYKLRVVYKGDFTALPTHAYHMYAPEVAGYSGFEHFTFYEKAYVEPYVTEYNTTLNVHWGGIEPAVLKVNVDGVESEHVVVPGENEIVVGAGQVTYSFESDEEYFEGEVASSKEEEQKTPAEENVYKGLLLIIAGAVVLIIAIGHFWKKK